MLYQNTEIVLGTLAEFAQIQALVKKFRPRIGKWWNKESLREVLCKEKNRVAVCAFDKEGGLVGFIILQLWGSKGKFKGHCKSLVTVSTKKGIGTLLQSLLPFNTVGYVSERNVTQNHVMKNSGYILKNQVVFQGRKMNIWIKELDPKISLQDAQRSLTEKLLSMAKWAPTTEIWQPLRRENQPKSVSA